MNKEAIKKWLAALRSGDYKKCQKFMRYDHSFCAIGVLCDIHFKECGKKDAWHAAASIYRYYGAMYKPPEEVREWLGIPLYQHLIFSSPTVVSMNDNTTNTFPEIADMIEKKIKLAYPNFFEEE